MKLLVVSLIFVSVYCHGQEQYADASLAIGNREGTLSLSYFYNWQIGKKKKFEIGLAGRFTAYLGSTQYYITAPAELTSGDTGATGNFFRKYSCEHRHLPGKESSD